MMTINRKKVMMMSRMSMTNTSTIITAVIIFIVISAIVVTYLYGEYIRNKNDIENDERAEALKQEAAYWKYQAEHPHMRITLEGKGWEELPDEYK